MVWRVVIGLYLFFRYYDLSVCPDPGIPAPGIPRWPKVRQMRYHDEGEKRIGSRNNDSHGVRGKKGGDGLVFPFYQVNFYQPGAGPAGIILLVPAGIARPAPAEHALAEPGYRVRRAAEIACVLREAVGVL
jgi:hypothetical protein